MRSVCVSILTVLILCASAQGYDWAGNTGDGSVDNPYQIFEPQQLTAIGADPNLFDRHFVLTNDIVLTTPETTGENTFNCPVIGNTDQPFTGTFDGQGYAIASLYIEDYQAATDIGLFGVVESLGENSGIISRLTLKKTVYQHNSFQSKHRRAGRLYGNRHPL